MKRIILISAFLFGYSFVIQLLTLLQTIYANGWDGYYYLLQLKSLLQENKLHSPDYSPIYLYLYLFSIFFSSKILAVKVGVAVLVGVYTLSIFAITKRITQSILLAAIIAGFTIFSPSVGWFALQYPKNFMGVVFFLIFIWAILANKKVTSLVSLVFAVITHRLTAGLVIIFLLLKIIIARQYLIMILIILLMIVIFIIGLFIPGILNIFDLARFDNFLQSSPQFAIHTFCEQLGYENVSIWWLGELYLLYIVAILGLLIVIFSRNMYFGYRAFLLSFLILCILLIIPFYNLDVMQIGFRFWVAFLSLVPIGLIIFLKFLKRNVCILILILIMMLPIFSYKSYKPEVHDPPYKMYETIIHKLEKSAFIADIRLLIVHNSFAQMITYETDISALPWVPEYEVDKESLWRIAYMVEELDYHSSLNKEDRQYIRRLSLQYHLIREDIWQGFRKAIKKNENEMDKELASRIDSWHNPYRQRPQYLLQKKE